MIIILNPEIKKYRRMKLRKCVCYALVIRDDSCTTMHWVIMIMMITTTPNKVYTEYAAGCAMYVLFLFTEIFQLSKKGVGKKGTRKKKKEKARK
jgi:hypothetical protein